MLVWSGRGILSTLVFGVSFLILVFLMPEYAHQSLSIAFFITAAFSWFYGNRWNNQTERVLTDERTGQRILYKNSHSLFWIPMQYWGIISFVAGLIILFQYSVISSVILTIALGGFILYNTYFKKSNLKLSISNPIANSKRLKQEQLKIQEEIIRREAEEVERLKRIKEKEDPRRFMPK